MYIADKRNRGTIEVRNDMICSELDEENTINYIFDLEEIDLDMRGESDESKTFFKVVDARIVKLSKNGKLQ